MEIDSSLINTIFKDSKYTISWRNIMLYAAAINDSNPYYINDERDGGIISHPLFPVRLTLPIVENLGDYISEESQADFPYEILMRVVHYSEYLKIHRLIKPDDEIKISSKFVAMLPHRAGTHSIVKFEGKDTSGEPVFTEYIGGMLRGVELVGDEIGREEVPTIPRIHQNSSLIWRKHIFIDPLRPFIYDGCTETTLPFHTSKDFAHQVGLPDIILQGVCTLGMAISEIVNEELDGDPTKVTDIGCKFTAMIIPNSDIHLELTNKTETNKSIEFFFKVINTQDKKAIRDGYLRSMI